MTSVMRRLIALLGSLKISVVLLLVLAVVLGWGTIIESTESREAAQRVYGAAWFYVLQWFLAVNVLFSCRAAGGAVTRGRRTGTGSASPSPTWPSWSFSPAAW